MVTELWDRHGYAIAYVDEDGESIYLLDGTPVAWLFQDAIYAYSGRLLGWMREGWIFGRDGKCLLFTAQAHSKPSRPFRQVSGDRGDRGVRPSRGVRDTFIKRPERAGVWASTSSQAFFVR
jgi:4-fold beta flower protein